MEDVWGIYVRRRGDFSVFHFVNQLEILLVIHERVCVFVQVTRSTGWKIINHEAIGDYLSVLVWR